MSAVRTREELEELRQRFQLLEGDRKAYYQISMQKMKENKETIRDLRARGKDLRKELGFSRKTNRTLRKNTSLLRGTVCDLEQREAHLDRHISMLRKNLDTIKAKVNEKQTELNRCRDEALALEKEQDEGQATRGSEALEKIRSLELQLDRALVKHNDAQNIKITYTEITKRLEKERVTYDNKLSSLQRTFKAKELDCEELTALELEAFRARDSAMKNKEKAVESLEERRRNRKAVLQERRALRQAVAGMVASAEKMIEAKRRIKEEEEKQQKESTTSGLRKTMLGNAFALAQTKQEEEAIKHTIDQYEAAFEKIRMATGISNIVEVLDKFYSQTNTRENLEAIAKENENKIDARTATVAALRNQVESARFTGLSVRGTDRKSFDEIEEWLTKAEIRLASSREQADEMNKLIVGIQGGVNHLLEKLASVGKCDDPRQFVHVQPDTLELLVDKCSEILVSLLEDVRNSGLDECNLPVLPNQESLPSDARPYNNRVALELFENYIGDGNLDGNARENREHLLEAAAETEDREKEVVMTRANIKKASMILANSKAKRKTTVGSAHLRKQSTASRSSARKHKTTFKGKAKPGEK